MKSIPYTIGGKYKYPNSDRVFVLKSVRTFTFHFECGHWCTDSVFIDLIDLSTGRQIYDIMRSMPGKQLSLF